MGLSIKEWVRLEWADLKIKSKTYLHPESLGTGDRRTRPRRRADRRRDRIQRGWLALLTAGFVAMGITLQGQIEEQDTDRTEGTENRCDLIRDVIAAAVDLGADPNSRGIARLKGREEECRNILKDLKEESK